MAPAEAAHPLARCSPGAPVWGRRGSGRVLSQDRSFEVRAANRIGLNRFNTHPRNKDRLIAKALSNALVNLEQLISAIHHFPIAHRYHLVGILRAELSMSGIIALCLLVDLPVPLLPQIILQPIVDQLLNAFLATFRLWPQLFC